MLVCRAKKPTIATVIDYGPNVTATMVVSQRPFDTWHEVIGEPIVADAICDRVFSYAEK